MMDILQETSDKLADNIVDRIKKLKISDQQGENVEVIVSLTRSAIKQLENLRDHNGNSLMPLDFSTTLLKIFQTSSVPKFNKHFEDIMNENLKAELLPNSTSKAIYDPTSIIEFAEQLYKAFVYDKKWHGTNRKGSQSAFLAGNYKCFNCGGNHLLTDCDKP